MATVAAESYARAVTISKSDTVNYDGTVTSTTGQYQTTTNQKPIPADAIYVGGAGIVVAIMEDGSAVQFTAVAGQILPIRTIRVNSTTTAATLLVALYYL